MAISDQLTTLNTIKTNIKAAIIAKGGTATDDFTTYATAISNLPSGGGSADLIDLIEGDITSIDIPSGTTSIAPYAFYNCTSLTSVTIPNSVTSIGHDAFYGCTGLTSVTIGNSVTTIDYNAFQGCTALTSITIPNSVTTISNNAFKSCSNLASVTLGNSVTTIGNEALRGTAITGSLVLPDSVTTIGQMAFHTTGLTSITLGVAVTSIGTNAFPNGLTSFTCLATTPPTIAVNTFIIVPAECPIYVPAESVEAYKAASNWSARAAYIQAIPSE